jgi:hypothetical protein
MSIRCPKCGLHNPPDAQRCDCGWDLIHGNINATIARERGDIVAMARKSWLS